MTPSASVLVLVPTTPPSEPAKCWFPGPAVVAGASSAVFRVVDGDDDEVVVLVLVLATGMTARACAEDDDEVDAAFAGVGEPVSISRVGSGVGVGVSVVSWWTWVVITDVTSTCEVDVVVGSAVDEAGRVVASSSVVCCSADLVEGCCSAAVGDEVVDDACVEVVGWTVIVVWAVGEVVGVSPFSAEGVVWKSVGMASTELELELELARGVAELPEEGSVTVTILPAWVICILAVDSETLGVASTLTISMLGLEVTSEVTMGLEEADVTVTGRPPPPVCMFCVFAVVSAALKVDATMIESTVAEELAMRLEEGAVLIIAPPPPVACVFAVVSAALGEASTMTDSTEASELAPTVAARVEDGTATVTTPPPPVLIFCALEVAS